MEIVVGILILVCIALVVTLIVETRAYNRHRKQVELYAEAAVQFVQGFETIKNTVNYNADIVKEVIDKTNTHSRSLIALNTIVDIHDRALNLTAAKDLTKMLDEMILPPKMEESE
jgi:hypothetical protein